jgi:hypothetical protein
VDALEALALGREHGLVERQERAEQGVLGGGHRETSL